MNNSQLLRNWCPLFLATASISFSSHTTIFLSATPKWQMHWMIYLVWLLHTHILYSYICMYIGDIVPPISLWFPFGSNQTVVAACGQQRAPEVHWELGESSVQCSVLSGLLWILIATFAKVFWLLCHCTNQHLFSLPHLGAFINYKFPSMAQSAGSKKRQGAPLNRSFHWFLSKLQEGIKPSPSTSIAPPSHSFAGRCKKHFQLRFIVACIGLGGVAASASLALHFSAHYFTEQFRSCTLRSGGGLEHFVQNNTIILRSNITCSQLVPITFIYKFY